MERAAAIAELLKSLSREAPQTFPEGLQIHVHGPIVIAMDPDILLTVLKLLAPH